MEEGGGLIIRKDGSIVPPMEVGCIPTGPGTTLFEGRSIQRPERYCLVLAFFAC